MQGTHFPKTQNFSTAQEAEAQNTKSKKTPQSHLMHSTYLRIVLCQRDEECKCCAKKITATSFVPRPCAYNRTLPPGQCHTSTWKIFDNCFFKEENQIVHFHLILVPIAKGKIDITL